MIADSTVIELRGRVSSLEEQISHLVQGQRLLHQAQETLDEIARLEDNWDSYGAQRPTAAAISAAHVLLGRLWDELGPRVNDHAVPWAVAPLADGGVQCEWRGATSIIEVEIDSTGTMRYLVERDAQTISMTDVASAAGTRVDEIIPLIRDVLLA
jgi:hypothetical protein